MCEAVIATDNSNELLTKICWKACWKTQENVPPPSSSPLSVSTSTVIAYSTNGAARIFWQGVCNLQPPWICFGRVIKLRSWRRLGEIMAAPPQPTTGSSLGSVVSAPSGVRGGTLAENRFDAFPPFTRLLRVLISYSIRPTHKLPKNFARKMFVFSWRWCVRPLRTLFDYIRHWLVLRCLSCIFQKNATVWPKITTFLILPLI